MATSSILEKICVNNPKIIEQYAAALENAEYASTTSRPVPIARQEHSPDALKAIMQKGIATWGMK